MVHRNLSLDNAFENGNRRMQRGLVARGPATIEDCRRNSENPSRYHRSSRIKSLFGRLATGNPTGDGTMTGPTVLPSGNRTT